MFNDETAQSFIVWGSSIHAASFGAAPWERTAIFFPETDPVFTDQSKMRAQAAKCCFFPFFSVVFIAFCFVFVFASHLFLFLNRAGVFVSNSEAIVVPPVFPFCSPCLPCQSIRL